MGLPMEESKIFLILQGEVELKAKIIDITATAATIDPKVAAEELKIPLKKTYDQLHLHSSDWKLLRQKEIPKCVPPNASDVPHSSPGGTVGDLSASHSRR